MINRLLSSAAIGLLLIGCAEPPPPEAPPQPPPVAAAPPPAAAPTPEPAQAPVPAAEPAPAPPPPAIKIVALKVIAQKKGTGTIGEVKADGTILLSKKPFGKIVGSEIQTTEGKRMVSLGANGAVLFGKSTKVAKFNASDELEVEGGSKFLVGNDGVPTEVHQDGRTETAHFKIEGLTPEGKRTAILVALVLMTSGDIWLPPPPPDLERVLPPVKGSAAGKGSSSTQGKGEAPKSPKKP